jgi:hypothetical protein
VLLFLLPAVRHTPLFVICLAILFSLLFLFWEILAVALHAGKYTWPNGSYFEGQFVDNEALTNFQSCQIHAAHVDFSGVAGKNPIFIRLPNILTTLVGFVDCSSHCHAKFQTVFLQTFAWTTWTVSRFTVKCRKGLEGSWRRGPHRTWVEDIHGYGVYVWTDGCIYKGQWVLSAANRLNRCTCHVALIWMAGVLSNHECDVISPTAIFPELLLLRDNWLIHGCEMFMSQCCSLKFTGGKRLVTSRC